MSNEEQNSYGGDILFKTTAYFESAAAELRTEPNSIVATVMVRFGMLIALQHPEYAQAYYRMTKGMQLEADAIENETVRSFISHVPLTSVSLGADQEERGD